jgi:hypothetical protein
MTKEMFMPIFKQSDEGHFVSFEETPFPHLEKELENWIEKSPQLVFGGEQLAIIGRQSRTDFGKELDLLAVDQTGATVIIELKLGEATRDVVAQAIEYAAWVSSLSRERIDEIASDYSTKQGGSAKGVADLYDDVFPAKVEVGESEERLSDRVTFNYRQRIVIFAEQLPGQVEQTLRYLRTQFGADVTGIVFTVHKSGGDVLISTDMSVGREQQASKGDSRTPRASETDESILARAKTDFVREAVHSIESWVLETGVDGLLIDHKGGSDHTVRYMGESWVWYYYAATWLYVLLYKATDAEVEQLQAGLSKPGELSAQATSNRTYRFHLAEAGDLEILKSIMLARVPTA